MGTSYSRKGNASTQEIWDWCSQKIFSLAAHIAVKENAEADPESRKAIVTV